MVSNWLQERKNTDDQCRHLVWRAKHILLQVRKGKMGSNMLGEAASLLNEVLALQGVKHTSAKLTPNIPSWMRFEFSLQQAECAIMSAEAYWRSFPQDEESREILIKDILRALRNVEDATGFKSTKGGTR